MSEESPTPNREVAYRLFAAEFEDATVSHTESDEERAPNYVISPTGARINRLFAVGALTEISQVNDEMLRARVVDPTGAFVVYAGQYQPDELAALEQLEPPAFVAVTGKARTFEPEDSDRVFTSIRPESIATVDADTRDSWVVDTAIQTVDRVGTYAAAADSGLTDSELRDALLEAGIEDGFAQGIALAQAEYGTTPAYLAGLRDLAVETAEVIAGERDEVSGLGVDPDETRPESPSYGALARAHGDGIDLDARSEEEVESGVGSDQVDASSSLETESETDIDRDVEAADARTGSAQASTAVDTESTPENEAAGEVDSSPSTDGVDQHSPDEGGVEADTDLSKETAEDAEPQTLEADGLDEGMYEMDDEEREELEAEFGAEFSTGTEIEEPGTADIDVPDDGAEVETDADSGVETESESIDGADLQQSDDIDIEPDDSLETDAVSDELGSFDADAGVDDGPETDVDDTAVESTATDESGETVEEETTDESEKESVDTPGEELADAPADGADVQDRVIEVMNRLDDGDGADRDAVVEEVIEETGAIEADVEDAIQDALMGGQCYEPDDETLKAI